MALSGKASAKPGPPQTQSEKPEARACALTVQSCLPSFSPPRRGVTAGVPLLPVPVHAEGRSAGWGVQARRPRHPPAAKDPPRIPHGREQA